MDTSKVTPGLNTLYHVYSMCSVKALLLKALHPHIILTGVTLHLSSPSPPCSPNELSLSLLPPLWQVSSPTAASPKTTRPDSRETGVSRLHNKDLLWWWNVLQGPKHPLKEISPTDKGSLSLTLELCGGRGESVCVVVRPNLIGSAAQRGRTLQNQMAVKPLSCIINWTFHSQLHKNPWSFD